MKSYNQSNLCGAELQCWSLLDVFVNTDTSASVSNDVSKLSSEWSSKGFVTVPATELYIATFALSIY